MPQRKVIAVDIDDVLSKSAEEFIRFSNRQWGLTLQLDDYHEQWAVLWNVPLEEALRRRDLFYSSGVQATFKPLDNALPALRRLAKKYDLVALTSRLQTQKVLTEIWLDRHFPGVFKKAYFAGIWDQKLTGKNVPQTLAQTKGDMCRAIGADYLIDDQLKHCAGAAKVGTHAILFGDYGWNRDVSSLPTAVSRAKQWSDVVEYFHV